MSTLFEWIDGSGETIALDVDVAKVITYERSAEVTEHPVENGAPIGDHVRAANGAFTLEGVISNAPVRVPTTQMRGLARAPGTVDLTVSGQRVAATLQRWSGPVNRKKECNDLLAALVAGRFKVALTTELESLDDLAMTRFKVTEDAQSGNALVFACDLKQLRLVGTARAAVPAVPTLQARTNRGPVPPDDRTLLARAADGGAAQTPEQRVQAAERARQRGLTGRPGR